MVELEHTGGFDLDIDGLLAVKAPHIALAASVIAVGRFKSNVLRVPDNETRLSIVVQLMRGDRFTLVPPESGRVRAYQSTRFTHCGTTHAIQTESCGEPTDWKGSMFIITWGLRGGIRSRTTALATIQDVSRP